VTEAEALPELGIGKVLEELRGECPTLSISKIRYLEDQELIQPKRTPAGYRKFTFGDVERLRFVLRQQAAPNFWPLSHIRQVLDEMDRGLVPDATVSRTSRVPQLRLAEDGLPSAETFREGRSQLRLSREELLESSGLDGDVLDAVEEFGLITRRPTQTYYDGADLQVASLVAEFAELGLEPRHLRHFGTAADREAGLIDQVVTPRSRTQDPDAAAETVAALAALSVRLHTVLVLNRLRG
jgi:DNA-binding transcriptional MerR regulator